MEVLTRTIPIEATGRYLVRVPEGSGPHPVLLGFHGYGENAEIHLGTLGRIPGIESWIVVAVQGPHWFYNTREDRVVAGWMTRLERERAIRMNVDYATKVLSRIRDEFESSSLVVCEGFSQGVAMAFRAAASGLFDVSAVIALGGDIPPDVREVIASRRVRFSSVLIGRGERDSWYTAEKLRDDLGVLQSAGLSVETCMFDGGHEWSDAFAAAAGRTLLGIENSEFRIQNVE